MRSKADETLVIGWIYFLKAQNYSNCKRNGKHTYNLPIKQAGNRCVLLFQANI